MGLAGPLSFLEMKPKCPVGCRYLAQLEEIMSDVEIGAIGKVSHGRLIPTLRVD